MILRGEKRKGREGNESIEVDTSMSFPCCGENLVLKQVEII